MQEIIHSHIDYTFMLLKRKEKKYHATLYFRIILTPLTTEIGKRLCGITQAIVYTYVLISE